MEHDNTIRSDFIRDIVRADAESGKCPKVVTRFPPEPNGYLHIGHAKAILLNHGIAAENNGEFHLRLDDTNPEAEDLAYVEGIKEDINWLGCDWGEHLYFASDYFERMYEYAVELIRRGSAYVCNLSLDEFKECRGVPTSPGKESPWRNRPVEENLDLFRRMRAGEFEDGACVLRAKADMSSPNLHMRDPALYRIKRFAHYRAGDKWCVYPTYDFAHCLEDSIEGITHSLCTLEFEVHRPIYDWILEQLQTECRPRQIEFARLNLSYTVMSKRKLLRLVNEGKVKGWDDPRLPTIRGIRRRGYTPASIAEFCRRIGITKFNSLSDVSLLEHCIRDELNKTAPRRMAVLNPVKLIIENYPEGQVEEMEAVNNPEDQSAGARKVSFSRELFIERDDFLEDPPKKFFRLAPGREVRLRYAYFVTCTGLDKDPETGEITAIKCSYDPATRGGDSPDGRKVKGTVHWVSAFDSLSAEVRLYDRLFTEEKPDEAESGDFTDCLNPESVLTVQARVERSLADVEPGYRCQFERKGYFIADVFDSAPGKPVFNRIVPLKDSWSKKKS